MLPDFAAGRPPEEPNSHVQTFLDGRFNPSAISIVHKDDQPGYLRLVNNHYREREQGPIARLLQPSDLMNGPLTLGSEEFAVFPVAGPVSIMYGTPGFSLGVEVSSIDGKLIVSSDASHSGLENDTQPLVIRTEFFLQKPSLNLSSDELAEFDKRQGERVGELGMLGLLGRSAVIAHLPKRYEAFFKDQKGETELIEGRVQPLDRSDRVLVGLFGNASPVNAYFSLAREEDRR